MNASIDLYCGRSLRIFNSSSVLTTKPGQNSEQALNFPLLAPITER